jgi:hypothetical protein
MKRSRNLFDNAFSIPSLLSAFQTASKNKRKRSDYWDFYLNLASEINSLHRELSDMISVEQRLEVMTNLGTLKNKKFV